MKRPQFEPPALQTLGIVLAGMMAAERSAERWEVARTPTTMLTTKKHGIVLVPKRWREGCDA